VAITVVKRNFCCIFGVDPGREHRPGKTIVIFRITAPASDCELDAWTIQHGYLAKRRKCRMKLIILFIPMVLELKHVLLIANQSIVNMTHMTRVEKHFCDTIGSFLCNFS